MNGKEGHLLILEDNELISGGLKHWIREKFPNKKVAVARSIAEAQSMLEEFTIDFMILDIMLPDGNGIDFLCDVKLVNPDVRVIVQTATPLPEYRHTAESVGTIRFMEKPIDLKVLESELRQHLKPHESASTPAGSASGSDAAPVSGVQAVLENLTLLDLVQLKCLSRTSSALEFKRPDGEVGRIFFRRGEIVHAETPQQTSVEALNTILSWQHGRVRELKMEESTVQRTIDKCWQVLLMEATQAIDEGNLGI